MATFNWFIFLYFWLSPNAAKQINAVVTLPRNCEAIFSLFSHDEIWGIQYNNITSDIIDVEVVIEDQKLFKIQKNPNSTISKINIIHPEANEVILNERNRINNTPKWNSSVKPDLFFTEYRNWIEYQLFIEALLIRYPSITSKTFLPLQTIQGRDIPVIKLSGSYAYITQNAHTYL